MLVAYMLRDRAFKLLSLSAERHAGQLVVSRRLDFNVRDPREW